MKKFIKYILSITGYKFVKRVGFKIIIQKETKLDKLLKRNFRRFYFKIYRVKK